MPKWIRDGLNALIFAASVGLAIGQGTITTVAGTGATTFSGDGGPASVAGLNHPRGLAVSAAGILYFTDVDNSRVRAVDATGRIFTVVGTGFSLEAGDGGLAVSASISDAMGVAVDAAGNVYVADSTNRRIRKISSNGTISSVAGVGVEGFSGDGGSAAQAMLGRPMGLAFDASGTLFFADSTNNRIRRIDSNGTISTVAGNGVPGFGGDGGLAINASIKTPTGVAVDRSGNVYFADADNNRIRRISSSGLITTVAGSGAAGFSGDGGLATSAKLNIPYDVTVDGQGNLFIADAGNNRIRKVDSLGVITTIAGTGDSSFSGDNGPASQAALNFPWGLAVDAAGNLYVADRVNSRVRKIAGAAAPTPPLSLGAPTIQQNGVMNGASFAGNSISPGSIVVVFGTDFAASATPATAVPLPTLLGDTSVTFNGIPAPLYYVSSKQINVQAPFDLPLGTASIQVRRAGQASAAQIVNVTAAAPGIFILDPVANTGVILHGNFTLVTNAAPARAGETVVIYTTGMGPVKVPVASGAGAPGTAPLAETVTVPTVMIGGASATVSYSGLAPGFVGVYQINLVVPNSVQTGNAPVQIITGGATSNTVMMAVTR